MKLARAAVCSVALLLSACDSAVTPEEYIARAEVHSEAGDLRAAVVELRNAVQADPENATAYLRLGRAYVDLGNFGAGERALQRARDLKVDYAQLVEPLGRAWLHQEKLNQILHGVLPEHAAVQVDRVAILNTRGDAFLALSDSTDAVLSYSRALALDPTSIHASVGLVRAAMLQGDTERAESALRAAAMLDAGHPAFLAAEGDLAASMQDFAGAEDAYQALVDLQPENLLYRVVLAQAQLSNGKADVAISHLDAVLSQQTSNLEATYLRAVSAYQTGDYEGAKQHSDTVLRAEPRHSESLLLSGAAQFALGRWDEAYRQLNRFLFNRPDHIGAVKLRAAAALRIDRSDETLASLENALARDAEDVQLLALIGAASFQSGDAEAATTHFRRLIALQPDDPNLWQQLGLTELARGNRAEGLAALEQALAIDSNLGLAIRVLAIERLRDGDLDKALPLAQRLQELEPGDADGYNLAALAHIGEDDVVLAETGFRRALEISPGNASASISLARLLAQQGRNDESRVILEAALERSPDLLPVLLALADLAGVRDESEQRRSWLAQAANAHPRALAPSVLLARQYLLDGDFEEAGQVTETALIWHPKNADLLRLHAQTRLQLGLVEEAVRPLIDLVTADSGASDARRLLIGAYLRLERVRSAEEHLEELLLREPADFESKLTLLRVLLGERKRLSRAGDLLAELRKDAPNHPDLLGLAGSLALLEGRSSDAVRFFSQNVVKQPTSKSMVSLASAHAHAGDIDAGRSILENWLQGDPADATVRVALGNLYLASDDIALATEQYEHVVALSEENVGLTSSHMVALNNLAWIYLEQGEPQKSLPLAEKAYELAPDNGRVLDTYAMVLLAIERPDEAVALLKKALELLPDQEDIVEHLATAQSQSMQPQ